MTATDNVIALGAPSKPFKRDVEIVLTPGERASYGESLARKKIERDHLVEAAKEEARRRKNLIADVAAEINRLAAAVDTGKEFREVQVYSRLEGAHMVTRLVDGDVEIDRRAASLADQQLDIPGLDDGDDFASENYQQDKPEMVTSSSGDTCAVMGHGDEGELPSEDPTPTASKAKRGRKAKAS